MCFVLRCLAGYIVDLSGVEEYLHVRGDGADLVEYLFCGGCPLDGLTVVVPVLDERLDRFVESFYGGERATSNHLSSEDTVPNFDLVRPGRAGGSEVKDDSGNINFPIPLVMPEHYLCPRRHGYVIYLWLENQSDYTSVS